MEGENVSISLNNLYKIKGGTERIIAGLESDVKVSTRSTLAELAANEGRMPFWFA